MNKNNDKPKETGRCKYCGKVRPIEELKVAKVYINGEWREDWYCKDDGCASYAQMSAEG